MAITMLRIRFLLVTLLSVLSLSGCSVNDNFANVPVKEAWRQPLRAPITYVVQPGDSLYSIAWMYGLDYQQVAQVNHIAPSYRVHTGQKLQLRPRSDTATSIIQTTSIAPAPATLQQQPALTSAVQAPTATANAQPTKATAAQVISAPASGSIMPPPGTTNTVAGITWTWPAQGSITNGFASTNLNRGVDIAGKLGGPVIAAAAGKVVYAGSGLRGYGQLVIIKHTDEYLSAYAHNQKLLVHEGQVVRLGQQIATLGTTEANSPVLHFEIRQNGKPVDPLKYLPGR